MSPDTTTKEVKVDQKEAIFEDSKVTTGHDDISKNQSFDNVQPIEGFSDIDSETANQKSVSTTRQVSSSSATADKYRVLESEDDLGECTKMFCLFI